MSHGHPLEPMHAFLMRAILPSFTTCHSPPADQRPLTDPGERHHDHTQTLLYINIALTKGGEGAVWIFEAVHACLDITVPSNMRKIAGCLL